MLNSVFWSFLYGGGCYSRVHNPGGTELAWLRQQLDALSPGTSAIVLMHIPPGNDPRGTTIVHRAIAVPFLTQSSNAALMQILASRASALHFIVGAHTHRYDFRIAGGVPTLVASSVSPIYRNNPAFFVLDVAADGGLLDVHPYTYELATGTWIAEPSFDAMYGVHGLTPSSLAEIAKAIRNDANTRAVWQDAFDAWTRADGGMGKAWLPYACAQSELEDGYAACAGTANRTHALVVLAAATLLGIAIAAELLLRRRVMRGR